ncbi:FMN-dependent NADH-azoreductase [Dickeya solani]|uniref:FMN dependent NADH:quinone oxidoreductase n=1 Tax=Dickeya solani TaxID=1089444 RepID=A0ABU4EJX1_9GAMM|nr:NAD(P)H-dependent oxidoreductase [Dickeya solani]MCA6999715.1 NAD(P)H-dependent oxidoreductase [Dickeya solani]MCZ0820340.1 NAD(P)H-dependent oxidoreductase [Dickeya solani]MDV6993926.1 NAD(P)H-dependent oxidoreductase [Dickeya solani]MDV7005282.1 NAD(P)H-dependent oxidoreductase [Dickeya solani]MDV7039099.1 NAD(P)H-dependent oxidoreductase [Dickeya solani]
MSILHIDSSILGSHSVSRLLSADIVARQLNIHPGKTVIRRDLVADAAWHLSPDHLSVFQGGTPGTPALGQDIALGGAYINELFAADVIVIGAPMYNFSISSQLKGWIDRVLVAGHTFRYTEHGPEGLLPAGKKVFIASARGGIYSSDSPAAQFDHQEPYLTAALNFIGLTDITIIRAEGLALGDEAKTAAMAKARVEIDALIA